MFIGDVIISDGVDILSTLKSDLILFILDHSGYEMFSTRDDLDYIIEM